MCNRVWVAIGGATKKRNDLRSDDVHFRGWGAQGELRPAFLVWGCGMDDISRGFLEALENDFAREIEHVSGGIMPAREEPNYAHINSDLGWGEVNREHQFGKPVIPLSEFRMPRIKVPKTASNSSIARIHAGPGGVLLEAGISSIMAGPGAAGPGTGKSKRAGREFDLKSFNIPEWTLAKGWRNRPKKKVYDKAAVSRDIGLFRRRFDEGRKQSQTKGFRFGAHGDSATAAAAAAAAVVYDEGGSLQGSLGNSSTSTLRRLRRSLTSFNDSTELNSLSGPDRLACIQFQISMQNFSRSYHPADVQGILNNNRVGLHSAEVAERQSSRAGSRIGTGNRPILVPRSGSPLARAKDITFGHCKRFPYNPDIKKRRVQTHTAVAMDDYEFSYWDD